MSECFKSFSRFFLMAFAVASVTAACDSKGAADDKATVATGGIASSEIPDDLRDVSRYTLTTDKMDKYFDAMRNMMLAMKDMTPEERERSSMSFNASQMSLDQYAEAMGKNEPVREAIEKADLSTREFAVLQMAIFQSAMAQGVIAMRPNDSADSLAREMKANPANVRFMKEHEADFASKQKALEAEMRRLGISDDGSD